jgi:hypothetical protein
MSQASDASLNHDHDCDCDDCCENSWECAKCGTPYRLELDDMRPIQVREISFCTDCVSAFYKHLGRTLCVMMYHVNTDKDIADHLEREGHDDAFDARLICSLMQNNNWTIDMLRDRIADLKPLRKRKRSAQSESGDALASGDDDDDDNDDSTAENNNKNKKQRTK